MNQGGLDRVSTNKEASVDGPNSKRRRVYSDRPLQEICIAEEENYMVQEENNMMNIHSHVPNEDLHSKTKQYVEDKNKQNWEQHDYGKQRKVISAQKRQCSTTNFIADNSMEDTNIHVQDKVLQLPTKQSTIDKNKGNMNQNDHMQQGKNNSNAYKKQQCNIVDIMDANSLEIGTNVFLKSWKNRKKNVAVASIVSCDPTRKVAGVELGTEYLMVHVHFPLAKYEELIRPYKGYKIIGNVVGLDIAWPAIFVDKINGS
uniref:Transposase Tnp1/En/Spm-like domain-containing protein n=1 Tax=Oryza glumipatula TaxID=40148 RepID=A0A0D9ZJI5_9ORYZ